jgi:hypothetical protein
VGPDQSLTEHRISRREFHRLAAAAGVGLLVPEASGSAASEQLSFAHPGILHSAVDLERMRNGVRQGRSPIADGFKKLREHPLSQADYVPQPFGAEIGRNPAVNFSAFDSDANAAYQCSLMAAITGDRPYANIARTIILGWSESLQTVSGADAVLMAGLGPFKLINAAEILRAIGELDRTSTAKCAEMLRRAILPTVIDFAPFANGNWDTAAIKTMLALAVFCDDRALFERALVYYLYGDGNGRLTHYVYESGQCQESGRDQQHTQLGLAHMGDACEIAWHQGLDLYGATGNRLLLGFEYTAAYNLGDEVEFHPDVDRTGKYRHQVISQRGLLRPVYEQILAHYHVRRGLPTPAVERAIAKVRPEGASQGADHTGFGTLLYALAPTDAREKTRHVEPAGIRAQMQNGAAELAWLAPRNPPACWLERAEDGGGILHTKVAAGVEKFRDSSVEHGKLYSYCFAIHGHRASGSSPAAVKVMAGLPSGWHDARLGNPSVPGNVEFDGKVLTVHVAGAGLLCPSDEGHFVAMTSDCVTLTARFVPQTASQFVMFGLACRQGLAANAPCTALVTSPAPGDRERQGWHIRFLTRDNQGAVKIIFDAPLEQPVTQFGRLIYPVWFRLRRRQEVIFAEFSANGVLWKDAGQAADIEGALMGMVVSSCIAGVDTAVRFDSLEALST